MGIYENYCLPHMLNLICGLKVVQEQRKKVVPLAEGRVLEIGMGTGAFREHAEKGAIQYPKSAL